MTQLKNIITSVAASILWLSVTDNTAYSQTTSEDSPAILVDQETGENRELLQFDWLSSPTGELTCQIEFYENLGCDEGDRARWHFSFCGGGSQELSYTVNFGADGLLTQTFPAQDLLPDGSTRTGTWQIQNGLPITSCGGTECLDTPLSKYVEHLGGNQVAFYQSDVTRVLCTTDDYKLKSLKSTVTGQCAADLPVIDAGICDYASAAINDGWGWNSVTGESCPPTNTPITTSNGCDYSNADIHDGWGWNPLTRVSCAPR